LSRKIAVLAVLGAFVLLVVAAGSAAAAATPPTHKPVKILRPPAQVKVGRVTFGRTPAGRLVGLVAVRYPIQAANRGMTITVAIEAHRQEATRSALVQAPVSAGSLRAPERRRTFTFVHEVPLTRRLAAAIESAGRERQAVRVRVGVKGRVDIDGDGVPDLGSKAAAGRRFRPLAALTPAAARAGEQKSFCASVPVVSVRPGGRAKIPLPACEEPVRWSVTGGAGSGTVHLGAGELSYAAPKTPGTQTIQLDHATVVVKVVSPWSKIAAPGGGAAAAAPGPVVRAMGDSVTAGFGYYSDGSLMPFLSLYECKPAGTVLDDACSSNSTATANGLKEVPYAPDYGLANNVSWAAQWANQYSVTNYKNFAVSGSEPINWAPGGNLYPATQKIEAEDPDYILMTIGANPILANTLFGLGSMRCALESDIFGGYQKCVEEAFDTVHLRAELKRLYANLVEKTDATIYLMQYHLSIPSSALLYGVSQIAEMGKLMNETIAAVAGEVNVATKSQRLQVVAPPHFNVGVSLEPVYPSSYTCSYFEYGVDGPSVQSTPTQDELDAAHYLSFCEGPKGGGEPWVISGDTGIHPSAAGYAQMASQVPPPAPPG
jgi:lysophospholipase L1-like esterase